MSIILSTYIFFLFHGSPALSPLGLASMLPERTPAQYPATSFTPGHPGHLFPSLMIRKMDLDDGFQEGGVKSEKRKTIL